MCGGVGWGGVHMHSSPPFWTLHVTHNRKMKDTAAFVGKVGEVEWVGRGGAVRRVRKGITGGPQLPGGGDGGPYSRVRLVSGSASLAEG